GVYRFVPACPPLVPRNTSEKCSAMFLLFPRATKLDSGAARGTLGCNSFRVNRMGAFGSGRTRGHRLTVEDCPRLNVHALHRAGALIAGAVTRWHWPYPAAPLTVRARCENGRLLLSVNGGDEVPTPIAREPGTFGGSYPLFECSCGRRTWNLYARDFRFACRHCFGLDYASKHLDRWSPVVLAKALAALQRREKWEGKAP